MCRGVDGDGATFSVNSTGISSAVRPGLGWEAGISREKPACASELFLYKMVSPDTAAACPNPARPSTCTSCADSFRDEL